MELRNKHDNALEEVSGLLSADEAVALLPRKMGVSRTTLMRWAKAGKIPSVQPVPHSRRFFRRDDILRLLEPRGEASGSSADRPLPGLEEL